MISEFYNLNINILNYQENIKRIETIFRNSLEYKSYLAYIYSCNTSIVSPDYKDILLNDNKQFKSEFHHTVFTLYELVELVCMKMFETDYNVSVWDVVKKLSDLHLDDKVCGAVISKSYHDAVHLGARQITKDTPGLHLGNIAEFVKEYKNYITPQEIDELKGLGMIYEEKK